MKSPFLLLWLVFAAGLFASMGAAQAGSSGRPVVVELYTSQGCSECSPADAFVAQLADRPNILALTLPVTYWDMLGWKDTLATSANTARQKVYADVMKRGGVYTPQIIVDGASDVVGGRLPLVEAAISARQGDMTAIPVEITTAPAGIHIMVGSGKAGSNATVWLFRTSLEKTVTVTAGENQGRTLTYRNVVRDIRSLGTWNGNTLSIEIPRLEGLTDHDGIAVVVQQGGYGRVIGAAQDAKPDYFVIR